MRGGRSRRGKVDGNHSCNQKKVWGKEGWEGGRRGKKGDGRGKKENKSTHSNFNFQIAGQLTGF